MRPLSMFRFRSITRSCRKAYHHPFRSPKNLTVSRIFSYIYIHKTVVEGIVSHQNFQKIKHAYHDVPYNPYKMANASVVRPFPRHDRK
jgi:hypothetical protein